MDTHIFHLIFCMAANVRLFLISSSLITKFGLHTHYHQELPSKDDSCHSSSYWTNLKTITSELITKEILVLVFSTLDFLTVNLK